MSDPPSAPEESGRAWITVVRISAGMLIRDFGADDCNQAKRLAERACIEQSDMAIWLWNTVADEIAMRDKSKL